MSLYASMRCYPLPVEIIASTPTYLSHEDTDISSDSIPDELINELTSENLIGLLGIEPDSR